MPAIDYQRRVHASLGSHFRDVRMEWSVVQDATDSLSRDIRRYAPRVDIAVGPFNVTPGPDHRISAQRLPHELRDLFGDLDQNPNPRCLLAIEVVFSGSSKHIMGDMLNASALGLYGIVVGKEESMAKIERIRKYLTTLDELKKLPPLFGNLVLLSSTTFDDRLRSLN